MGAYTTILEPKKKAHKKDLPLDQEIINISEGQSSSETVENKDFLEDTAKKAIDLVEASGIVTSVKDGVAQISFED